MRHTAQTTVGIVAAAALIVWLGATHRSVSATADRLPGAQPVFLSPDPGNAGNSDSLRQNLAVIAARNR
jgi:hypothetical protein